MYISIVWQYNKVRGRKAKYDEVLIMKTFNLWVCNYVSICSISSFERRGELYESDTGLFSSFPEDLSFDMFFLF